MSQAGTIRVENLRKEYRPLPGVSFLPRKAVPSRRGHIAVNGISFDLRQGEVVGFIGPNGAGKSTTIKILAGILTPDSGTVQVCGLDPQRDRQTLMYQLGTVFGQKSQLWVHLAARDTFRLLGCLYDIGRKHLDKRIDFFIEAFELSEFVDVPVRTLSLGQRIRCEIAASLIHKPQVLFLDEPTIGLDTIIKKSIRDLILRLNAEEKTTILLTSHDLSDIEKLCDRVLIINSGKLVYSDAVKNLKHSYLRKKVISLRTDSDANLDIPGIEVLKKTPYAAKLEVDTDAFSIQQVVQELMAKNSIADITIDDLPLEEVITAIYRQTAGGAAA